MNKQGSSMKELAEKAPKKKKVMTNKTNPTFGSTAKTTSANSGSKAMNYGDK